MRKITLTYPMKAVPKQSYRHGSNGSYQPKEITAFKQAVQMLTRSQLPRGHMLYDGCLFVSITVFYALPKSATKAKKALVGDENVIAFMNVRPDVDNLTKAIFDALNGVLWIDDARVVSLSIMKRYALTDSIKVYVSEQPVDYYVKKEF